MLRAEHPPPLPHDRFPLRSRDRGVLDRARRVRGHPRGGLIADQIQGHDLVRELESPHLSHAVPGLPPSLDPVGFHHLEDALRGERTGLDLYVRAIVVAQDVLPDEAIFRVAPGEVLPARHLIPVRHIDHALLQIVVVTAEEVPLKVAGEKVQRVYVIPVVGDLLSLMDRIPHDPLPSVPGGHGRDKPGPHRHALRGVGPEVVPMRKARAVFDTDVGVHLIAAGVEGDPNGPPHSAYPLDGSDEYGRGSVLVLPNTPVHVAYGHVVVAAREVELDASRDPRATQCHQTGLDHLRCVEDLPARCLVVRGVEVPSEFRQHRNSYELILQHQRGVRPAVLLLT